MGLSRHRLSPCRAGERCPLSSAPQVPGPVLGICGRSGSGKTTLITALIAAFAARGILVSTIKHIHHAVDLDQPGKDSWLHRQAGAHEVLLAGDARWALLHENRHPETVDLFSLLPRLAPVDLVLVEGFAQYRFARLEVQRDAICRLAGKAPLWPGDPGIEAVASDRIPESCDRVCLDLNDVGSICGWVATRFALGDPREDHLA